MKEFKTFTSFSVNDLEAARKFYSEKLELDISPQNEHPVLFADTAGETRFMAYHKEDHEPANFTVLNFEVDDLDAVAERLRGNGVRFESLEGTNEKGIAEMGSARAAWTKDPSGNWIGFFQGTG